MRASRSAEQARRVAVEVKLARGAAGLTISQAAGLAGVSRSTFERVEAADQNVGLDTLCKAAGAVGLDIVVRTYPGRRPSLRDTGQLGHADHLRSEASSAWRTALEIKAGDHGEAADWVAFGADEIQHYEIERLLVDFQAQYRVARIKRDWLAEQHSRPVRVILVVEDTWRNRSAASAHRQLIATALPAGSREILSSLRSGRSLGRDGLLWLRRRRR